MRLERTDSRFALDESKDGCDRYGRPQKLAAQPGVEKKVMRKPWRPVSRKINADAKKYGDERRRDLVVQRSLAHHSTVTDFARLRG